MLNVFPKSMPKLRQSKLENISIRSLTGGLTVMESDLGIDFRYQTELNNFKRTPAGSMQVRYGTQWFADINPVLQIPFNAFILDMYNFGNMIVSCTSRGEIVATGTDGVNTSIWNPTIAGPLGGPWTSSPPLKLVDFVPFKNELIIHNGVDKPVTVSNTFNVRYLHDPANGSNVFVPIGKFGCVVGDYHVIAGVTAAPTSIYVSSKGTGGVFIGAPIPNDGIIIDVGAYAPEGAPEIRGIAGFRNYLIVFFRDQSLIIRLGQYEGASHRPEFPDTMPQFGLISHRSFAQVDNDLLFGSLTGFSSAERNLVSSNIETVRVSERIEPLYRKSMNALTVDDHLHRVFMIRDKLEYDTVLYLPTGRAFCFSSSNTPRMRYQSWSTFTTPIWDCGCSTVFGRVFLAKGTQIYGQGNRIFDGEQHYADKKLNRDAVWVASTWFTEGQLVLSTPTGLAYTCLRPHTSGTTSLETDMENNQANPVWELYEGLPIAFILETPWLGGRDPMQAKHNRFISLLTKGTAMFNVAAYVDRLYKNFDDEVVYTPALNMSFIGDSAVGFGLASEPYGGGRRSADPRLFSFPVKFKDIKLRITGSSIKPLELAHIAMLFSRGKYHR